MLRINTNISTAGAKSYYSTADYYTEGQELTGQWRGRGSRRLGLFGEVKKKDWDALCDNLHPATGETLTLRQKAVRRVGYDFNFHVPKSVSLLYGLTKDERILLAFRESVNDTMRDMEAEMKTRVRQAGRNEDRTTGNMAWGEFIHTTSRPVDGIPDPHLHAHCFVFNSTWDDKESRWKAGQFADLKRDAPYFEAVFHSRMARRMGDLGLAVERTKTGWELCGIPPETLKAFSRRTGLIEDLAKEKGITDDRKKSELGAKTREKKQKDLSFEELRKEWRSRMTESELQTVDDLYKRIGGPAISTLGSDRAAAEAATLACDHCFERKSVLPERELLAQAIKRGVGKTTSAEVERAVALKQLIVGERHGRRMVTMRDVLAEEGRMIGFAREGRGTCTPLGDIHHKFEREWLNDEQRNAVLHVLGSTDRVMMIRGAAGVGKTSLMQEAVAAIESHGTRVFTFAPSSDASRGVLRSEGFTTADTVARLLKDERMQNEIKGQAIWIDEAGLLGTRTTAAVFDLAKKLDARVILSGDPRQHGSVERGSTLRLLETEAGIKPAEVREIQRQKVKAYKQAVYALSEGRVEEGFEQLDKLGWVREVSDATRYKALAGEYVATVAEGKSALVVSPTHLEGDRITGEIRQELKKMGRLGGTEHEFNALTNANLTQGERADAVNYRPGDVLVFHQNAVGYRKGQRVAVGEGPLPVDLAERFGVFHPGRLTLAAGDAIRVTRNGKTADGLHGLNNGAIHTIKGFDPQGEIVLTNGWKIGKDFGHLAHGYVTTSHASQGKTVDRVFIGQSSYSFDASSREQFYVSASRARERAVVYCDDKQALKEAVRRSDERLTATEFVGSVIPAAAIAARTRGQLAARRQLEQAVQAGQERTKSREHERDRGRGRGRELIHER